MVPSNFGIFRKNLLLGVEKVAIPALQDSSCSWVQNPADKANLFAQTFRDKWVLPEAASNLYSFENLAPFESRGGFLQLRSRNARFHLSSLNVASATGPDGLSTILLRNVSSVIAVPFSRLARRVVSTGVWPDCWKVHWIAPLHKRGKRSLATNYRGLQITCQLSKAMERFLGCQFLPHLSHSGSFGQSQFAYRKFHGARDAVLFVVLVWLRAFACGRKVGLYCSDVSGAFDRVSCEKLVAKLERSVIHRDLVRVIVSWLRGRVGKVIVQGSSSDVFALMDMCFQGTVWGPALWNIFFADAPLAMRRCAFQEIIYADDLNAYREFLNNVSNDFVISQLRRCQHELHEWGRANSVTFEPSKESFHILSHTQSFGNSFRLLGITIDVRLHMDEAVHECSVEGHWRLSSLLRSRRFFQVLDLILHYKSNVLSFLEYRTCAITHAADVHLNSLNGVQKRFLRNIDISSFDALQSFNLAPLSTRRDMANLGIIYRALLRQGPRQLQALFRFDARERRTSPRWQVHQYQVLDETRCLNCDFLNRSTFGYVAIFNLLPSVVFHSVEFDSPIPVKDFKKT